MRTTVQMPQWAYHETFILSGVSGNFWLTAHASSWYMPMPATKTDFIRGREWYVIVPAYDDKCLMIRANDHDLWQMLYHAKTSEFAVMTVGLPKGHYCFISITQ